MLTDDIKKQINQQLGNLLKNNPLSDMNENIKSIVMAIFHKLDLVTREEFDTQQKVLLATRRKLENLEELVQKLSEK